MIDARTFIKEPILFQKICYIYPPSVREAIASDEFGVFVKMLTVTAEELAEDNKEQALSPIEFLLNCAYNSPNLCELAMRAFKFFIHEDVGFWFEGKAIVIGEITENDTPETIRMLTEENYFAFQNAVRLAIGVPEILPPSAPNPDEDPRVTRIKEMARKRDRIKAKQAIKGGIELSESLVAICCMGIGITPLNIGEMSYAAIAALMNKCQVKEKYELDIRCLLAGADSKKIKPKYWIREKE